jgi:outer membrane autotransporter protein
MAVPFQTSLLVNSYNLVHATEGVNGAFSTLSTSGLPDYVGAALSYSDKDVTLDLTSQMAGQAGLSHNQSATGGAVDSAFNTGATAIAGNPTSQALSGLYSLAGDQLGPALGDLSGEAHASERSVLINDGLFTRQAILGRLRQLSYYSAPGPLAALGYGDALSYSSDAVATADSSGAISSAVKAPQRRSDPAAGYALWAQAYGDWGSFDGDSHATGVTTSLGGLVSGFDKRIGPNAYVGAALGYSQSYSAMASVGSSAQADSGLIAAYAGANFRAWNLRGGASYTLSQVDSSRSIVIPGLTDTARGRYDAGLAQIFEEIGYSATVQNVALEPFAGLAWAHLNTGSFTEQAAAVGLAVNSSASDVGYGTLGLRAATDIALSDGMVLSPRASAAWQYAFGDLTPVAALGFAGIGGAGFSVTGVPLARSTALLEVGADLRLTAALKLSLSYAGQFADNVRQNAVKGAVLWTF